jgi:hypothetical protein
MRAIQNKQSNKLFLFLLTCGISLLSGCVGNQVGSTSSTIQPSSVNTALNLSYTAAVSTYTDKASFTSMALINNSDSDINDINFKTNDPEVTITGSDCPNSLTSGSYCILNLKINQGHSNGDLLLEASGQSSSAMYLAKQSLTYTTAANSSGFSANQFANNLITLPDKLFAIVLPFTKDATQTIAGNTTGFEHIISQKVICNEFDPNQCSYIVIAKNSKPAHISLSLNSNNQQLFSSGLLVSAAFRGNLLSSTYNSIESSGKGGITLLNVGTESITGIKLANIPTNLQGKITKLNGCDESQVLAPAQQCKMNIEVDSSGLPSGSAQIAIAYNTINKATNQAITDMLNFWVVYPSSKLQASIVVSATRSYFTNMPLGSSNTISLRVNNSGKVILSNIRISNLPLQNTAFTSSNDCSSLAPSETCRISITYNPLSYKTGTLKAVVSADYIDSSKSTNNTTNIVNSSVNINYSTNPIFAYMGRWFTNVSEPV